MFGKFCSDKGQTDSATWTKQEESYVKYLRQEKTVKNWTLISQQLAAHLGCEHSSKQCRQRYINFIKFKDQQKLLEWTSVQMDLLFKKYLQIGPKWVTLAQNFNQKSQNCLKNKFYGLIRKLLRKINVVGKKSGRMRRPMRLTTILKPLQFLKSQSDCESFARRSTSNSTLNLRKFIICSANNNIENLSIQTVLTLIDEINSFSQTTRSMKIKNGGYKYIQHNQQLDGSGSNNKKINYGTSNEQELVRSASGGEIEQYPQEWQYKSKAQNLQLCDQSLNKISNIEDEFIACSAQKQGEFIDALLDIDGYHNHLQELLFH